MPVGACSRDERYRIPQRSSPEGNRIPETDYVAGHVLCERCSRIRDKSAMLRTLRGDYTKPEVFFHSQNLRQLLESSAAGCHLCAIMSQNIDLGRVEGHPDGGIVAKCWSMPLQYTSSKVFWITLRQLNQNGQAVIHTESDYSRIEELLAACDYDMLTYSHDIGQAVISEIDGTTPPLSPLSIIPLVWLRPITDQMRNGIRSRHSLLPSDDELRATSTYINWLTRNDGCGEILAASMHS